LAITLSPQKWTKGTAALIPFALVHTPISAD
jgi:hypothetical protein